MSRFVIGQVDGDKVLLPMGGVGSSSRSRVTGPARRSPSSSTPSNLWVRGAPYDTNEDEITYVLEATPSAEIDGEELNVEVGEYLFKPRGLKHEFWNPTSAPTRIIEIVAPAGLERLYRTAGTSRGGCREPRTSMGLSYSPTGVGPTRPVSDLAA